MKYILTILAIAISFECYSSALFDENYINQTEKQASSGDIKAQFQMGIIEYITSLQNKTNSVNAIDWFIPSAQRGERRSQFMLGIMSASGMYNRTKGKKWMELAVNNGCSGGAQLLFAMSLDKQFGEIDEKKAYEWLIYSAEHGDYVGQSMLAAIYFKGNKYIKKDPIKALAYMKFLENIKSAQVSGSYLFLLNESSKYDKNTKSKADAFYESIKNKHNATDNSFCMQSDISLTENAIAQ